MPADYGYINARIRGLKTKLLNEEDLRRLAAASDFSSFVNELAQTPYGETLETGRQDTLAEVDAAITKNFTDATQRILRFSDGDPHRLISMLLLRYDLNNLKSIARAKHAGRSFDDAESSLVLGGQLQQATLARMMEAPDLAGAAQTLKVKGHPLAAAFSKAVRRYTQDEDLLALELTLDRAYYETLLTTLEETNASKVFARHIQQEIDATNIRTAIKMQQDSDPQADGQLENLFIKGGKEIKRDTFTTLVRNLNEQSGEQVGASGLQSGALQPLVDTSFSSLAEAHNLSQLENMVRDSMDASAQALSYREPLGIGLVLRYIRLKEAEVAKLRLLARGKFYGVAQAKLEKELVSG